MKWPISLIALSIACSSERPVVYDLVITDVTLIDGTGGSPWAGVDVWVEDDRIAVIGEDASPIAERHVDGTGKYMIPGLIDAHVHPGKIEETFPQFIHFGVISGIERSLAWPHVPGRRGRPSAAALCRGLPDDRSDHREGDRGTGRRFTEDSRERH